MTGPAVAVNLERGLYSQIEYVCMYLHTRRQTLLHLACWCCYDSADRTTECSPVSAYKFFPKKNIFFQEPKLLASSFPRMQCHKIGEY